MNNPQQSSILNPKTEAFLRSHGLKDTLEILNERNYTSEYLDKFLSLDKSMIELKNKIRKLAPHNLPVLISGETGTGKELLANALHGNRKGSFVAVNVAGIPDTLLESEFFGCKKGAFTGCDKDRTGYLDECTPDGTLFLDEVGDMPLMLQCKLLRAIQDRRFRPIGDTKEREFNARIVAATNKNLLQMIEEKTFRADFYYRICGIELKTIPLRDRPIDINFIVKSLYPQLSDFQNIIGEWKGNVRELINYCESLKILSSSN